MNFDEAMKAVLSADDDASFEDLVKLSGLDKLDFRFADLSGVDFGSMDVAGYDFTGANLTGTNFSKAVNTSEAIFDGARLTDSIQPLSDEELLYNCAALLFRVNEHLLISGIRTSVLNSLSGILYGYVNERPLPIEYLSNLQGDDEPMSNAIFGVKYIDTNLSGRGKVTEKSIEPGALDTLDSGYLLIPDFEDLGHIELKSLAKYMDTWVFRKVNSDSEEISNTKIVLLSERTINQSIKTFIRAGGSSENCLVVDVDKLLTPGQSNILMASIYIKNICRRLDLSKILTLSAEAILILKFMSVAGMRRVTSEEYIAPLYEVDFSPTEFYAFLEEVAERADSRGSEEVKAEDLAAIFELKDWKLDLEKLAELRLLAE